MKAIAYLILAFLMTSSISSYSQCNSELQDKCYELIKGTSYLKDFKVRLQPAVGSKKAPVAKYSVALSKGSHYRFTVTNDQYKDAEAIIQVYDAASLVGTNYVKKSEKIYPKFDFVCNKTAVYTIMISFKDGKDGCSVAMISLVPDE